MSPVSPPISHREEGRWVVLNGQGAQIYDAGGEPVEREIRETALSGAMIGKGNYPHFMLKEIYEQPTVVGDTLRALFNPNTRRMQLPELPVDLATVPRVTVSACGTAFLAGFVAKYWLEQLARIPVDADIASEMRYRERSEEHTSELQSLMRI